MRREQVAYERPFAPVMYVLVCIAACAPTLPGVEHDRLYPLLAGVLAQSVRGNLRDAIRHGGYFLGIHPVRGDIRALRYVQSISPPSDRELALS